MLLKLSALNSSSAAWTSKVEELNKSPANKPRPVRNKIFAKTILVSKNQSPKVSKKQPQLKERLYGSRESCKMATASIAMHVSSEWRALLFSQIDNLMDVENWEDEDCPITQNSFMTLLRMLMLIKPQKRSGVGATSNGNIIATWTRGKDRLTIECMAGDKVRWVLSHYINGERESGAGETSLNRLLAVLEPYNPQYWFLDEY